jgi:hypothetical protein
VLSIGPDLRVEPAQLVGYTRAHCIAQNRFVRIEYRKLREKFFGLPQGVTSVQGLCARVRCELPRQQIQESPGEARAKSLREYRVSGSPSRSSAYRGSDRQIDKPERWYQREPPRS